MMLKHLSHCLSLATLAICCAGCQAVWTGSIEHSPECTPTSPWPTDDSGTDSAEIANPSLVRVAKQLDEWQEAPPKPERLPRVPDMLPSRFEPLSITPQ